MNQTGENGKKKKLILGPILFSPFGLNLDPNIFFVSFTSARS